MTDIAAAEGHIQTVYYVLAIFGILGGLVATYARRLQNTIAANAKESADRSEANKNEIAHVKAIHSAEISLFRETVARDYISATRFEAARLEIMAGIAALGMRMDNYYRPHQRPAE